MASEKGIVEAKRPRQGPGVVAPTTRVNLALPFSKITVEEPGKDLAGTRRPRGDSGGSRASRWLERDRD